jgi:hypothetical protein
MRTRLVSAPRVFLYISPFSRCQLGPSSCRSQPLMVQVLEPGLREFKISQVLTGGAFGEGSARDPHGKPVDVCDPVRREGKST